VPKCRMLHPPCRDDPQHGSSLQGLLCLENLRYNGLFQQSAVTNCLLPMSKAQKSVPFSFEHCSAKSYILSGVLVALSCLVTVGLLFCIALSSEDAVDRSVCTVCVRACVRSRAKNFKLLVCCIMCNYMLIYRLTCRINSLTNG
jgi:hypothetical protein